MKIKIPPYPNYLLQEGIYENLGTPDVKSESASESNHLLIAAKFETGKRLLKFCTVKYEEKTYVSVFPNPVHLFLSASIEEYRNSENIKRTNFPKCGKEMEENHYLLDIDENSTHECFNHFLKSRITSIILLVSALEAFLNQIIPNDFIYETTEDNYNKKEIESIEISFKKKLLYVIPQYLNKENFWDNLVEEQNLILKLYKNRVNLIHLKTHAENDFIQYSEAVDKMLDFDISSSINATIHFMNLVSEKFVEYKKGFDKGTASNLRLK